MSSSAPHEIPRPGPDSGPEVYASRRIVEFQNPDVETV